MLFAAVLVLALVSFTTVQASTSGSGSTTESSSQASSMSAQAPVTTETTVVSTGENSGSLQKVLGNKKFEETREITDAQMRADAGSLSRYSMKFNLSYFGPIINDLDNPDQPNPDKSIGPKSTAINGQVSGRFRLSPTSALAMGTGLKLVRPLHTRDRFDVNSPYLNYDLTRRFGGLQMRNTFGPGIVTNPEYTAVGEFASLSYSNSLVYDLGLSGVAVGLDSSANYYFYNRGYESRDRSAERYTLSMAPSLKYNLNDRHSFSTSVSQSWVNQRRTANQSVLVNRSAVQKLTYGYGYSRSLYIAPYLNFYPTRIASDTTTFNVSAIFSLL